MRWAAFYAGMTERKAREPGVDPLVAFNFGNLLEFADS